MSKELGGMDFRDLPLFNNAFLAKQCWRLIHFSSTLAARVLKACYFPESTILLTACSGSNSYLWKSFVWGLELLEARFRWRIGDDSSVLIYRDR
ncbi:hypothetical protein Ddye_001293 [Dipteronia dyeriana]|uniref:Reverse transcriptase zinc-binding domain-containing protein n=1 Tax=Dipteronia dyeriana TaxID=168575 RepID=A0AAD9XNB3_9ROSI|nr:hypothetical protein Ddye_001293 [Dipteronia dyeriana]